MDFIKNGTKVTLSDSTIKGTVIGVCIRGVENCTIEYHVQWVDATGVHDAWLYDYQVKKYVDTRQKAGLVNYSTEITVKGG